MSIIALLFRRIIYIWVLYFGCYSDGCDKVSAIEGEQDVVPYFDRSNYQDSNKIIPDSRKLIAELLSLSDELFLVHATEYMHLDHVGLSVIIQELIRRSEGDSIEQIIKPKVCGLAAIDYLHSMGTEKSHQELLVLASELYMEPRSSESLDMAQLYILPRLRHFAITAYPLAVIDHPFIAEILKPVVGENEDINEIGDYDHRTRRGVKRIIKESVMFDEFIKQYSDIINISEDNINTLVVNSRISNAEWLPQNIARKLHQIPINEMPIYSATPRLEREFNHSIFEYGLATGSKVIIMIEGFDATNYLIDFGVCMMRQRYLFSIQPLRGGNAKLWYLLSDELSSWFIKNQYLPDNILEYMRQDEGFYSLHKASIDQIDLYNVLVRTLFYTAEIAKDEMECSHDD